MAGQKTAITAAPICDGRRNIRYSRTWYLLPVMALLFEIMVAHADAYRWRDADGQVHYGDKPPAGAEAIEEVETFECQTEACREDLEQRRRDIVESNQEIEEWLQSRQAEREAARAEEDRTSVIYMPGYSPYPPLLVAPGAAGVPCLRGRHCAGGRVPGHRIPGRHHGSRPAYSSGHSSSRYSRRSYGFPVAK